MDFDIVRMFQFNFSFLFLTNIRVTHTEPRQSGCILQTVFQSYFLVWKVLNFHKFHRKLCPKFQLAISQLWIIGT